jgi:hypothetical protein
LVVREPDGFMSLVLSNRVPSDEDALDARIVTHRSLRRYYFVETGRYPDVVAAGDGLLDMVGNTRASINRSMTYMHGNIDAGLLGQALEYFGFPHVVAGHPKTFVEGNRSTGHVIAQTMSEREQYLIKHYPEFLAAVRRFSRRILREFGSLDSFITSPGYKRFSRLSRDIARDSVISFSKRELYALGVDISGGLRDGSVYAAYKVVKKIEAQAPGGVAQPIVLARLQRFLQQMIIEARKSQEISEEPL